jgi:hypothetical protein
MILCLKAKVDIVNYTGSHGRGGFSCTSWVTCSSFQAFLDAWLSCATLVRIDTRYPHSCCMLTCNVRELKGHLRFCCLLTSPYRCFFPCLLSQSIYDRGPAKIWHLRSDTLAIMMSLANIGAYSRVLLLESCQGLLAAAVAERLGGYGKLCCASTGLKPAPLDCVRNLNLRGAAKDAICCAPLSQLLEAKVGGSTGLGWVAF